MNFMFPKLFFLCGGETRDKIFLLHNKTLTSVIHLF
jgi:hypothetical protein